MTDEVKRDLRLLKLRGVMDPKRFYKSADQTKFPKYFQFGTVAEGPTEFYSGILPYGFTLSVLCVGAAGDVFPSLHMSCCINFQDFGKQCKPPLSEILKQGLSMH